MGNLIVTELDESATSKIPDRASRIECTRGCAAAVLSVRGEICNDCTLGTRPVSSVRYSACNLAVKARSKPCGEGVLEEWEDLSSRKYRVSLSG